MGHVGDTAFLPGQKNPISPGHVGDTAFLSRQITHITTFGGLGDLAHSEHTAVYSEHLAV